MFYSCRCQGPKPPVIMETFDVLIRFQKGHFIFPRSNRTCIISLLRGAVTFQRQSSSASPAACAVWGRFARKAQRPVKVRVAYVRCGLLLKILQSWLNQASFALKWSTTFITMCYNSICVQQVRCYCDVCNCFLK